MKALRYDVVRFDGFTRTPQGGIRVPANLARTGVQEYRRQDGTVTREYRPFDEVFHKDAVESFANAPLTIGHVAAVTPDNWASVSVGHVIGAPKQDGRFLAADGLQIMRSDAIRQVEGTNLRPGEQKLEELSCGYEVEIDPTPGVTPDGERYDAIQRSIRGNHVALLPRGAGRAGPEVRLRMDSADDATRFPGGVAYRLDETDAYPANVTIQSTPQTDPKAPPASDPKPTPKTDGADVLLGRIDALTAENAALKKRLDEQPAAIEAAARARAALLAAVEPLMPKSDKGEPWRADGKADTAIIREAVAVLRPELKLDGRSEDYVRGVFEAALEGAQASRTRVASVQAPLHPARLDGGDGDADMDDMERRNKAARQRSKDAWKTPPKSGLTRDSLKKRA
jgi:hypothetical protein